MISDPSLVPLILHDVLREAERIQLLLEGTPSQDSLDLARRSVTHLKNIGYASLASFKLSEKKAITPLQLDLEVEVIDSLRSLSLIYSDILKKVSISKDSSFSQICTDPAYLKVILDNVLENAYKFSKGDVEISMGEEKGYVFLRISNHHDCAQASSHGLGVRLAMEVCKFLGINFEASHTENTWNVTLAFSRL